MPTYDVQNKKTGEVKEIFCSYENRNKELKKLGKDWEYLVGAPAINYEGNVNNIKRAGGAWNDTLKAIHKASDKKTSNIEHY